MPLHKYTTLTVGRNYCSIRLPNRRITMIDKPLTKEVGTTIPGIGLVFTRHFGEKITEKDRAAEFKVIRDKIGQTTIALSYEAMESISTMWQHIKANQNLK